MPTLSLKAISRIVFGVSARGSICVLLFLLIWQLSAIPAYAQDQTEYMYPLEEIVISDCVLPEKVFENQKKKIIVSLAFDGEDQTIFPFTSSGTGVTLFPGIIVTNRHLLSDHVQRLQEKGFEYDLDKKGVPRGRNYTYEITGIVMAESGIYTTPLHLIAVERFDSERDIMALEIDIETRKTAFGDDWVIDQRGDRVKNPFKMFVQPLELADEIPLKESVFMSGFSTDGYFDIINFAFCGWVAAKIKNMPINQRGVELFYRVYGKVEYGFSGGATFQSDGKVAGLSTSASNNFIYVLSSKDITEFLKDHKIK